MNKRHDHRAAAYLLLGVGAAGRAFLAVPEGVSLAELSLTVLMVAGALLLTREGLQALCCGTAALALERVLDEPERICRTAEEAENVEGEGNSEAL